MLSCRIMLIGWSKKCTDFQVHGDFSPSSKANLSGLASFHMRILPAFKAPNDSMMMANKCMCWNSRKRFVAVYNLGSQTALNRYIATVSSLFHETDVKLARPTSYTHHQDESCTFGINLHTCAEIKICPLPPPFQRHLSSSHQLGYWPKFIK